MPKQTNAEIFETTLDGLQIVRHNDSERIGFLIQFSDGSETVMCPEDGQMQDIVNRVIAESKLVFNA
jgi:hypothetical protein